MSYKHSLFLLSLFAQFANLKSDCMSCKAPKEGTIASEVVKKEFTVSKQTQLAISTDCTEEIHVTEGKNDSTVIVTVTKKGSQESLDNIIAHFKTSPSHIGVEVYNPKKQLGATSIINVIVPQGMTVSCHCRGKTTLKGAITEAFVETLSEPVTIKGIKGTLDIRTDSGDITVADSRGTIVAQTSTGEVSINNAFESLYVTSSSGTVHVRNPQKNVEVNTRSGNISLEMISVSAAQIIRARTTSGDVSCALPKNEDPSIVVYQKTGSVHGDHFRYKKQRDSWLFGKPTPPRKKKNKALIYINAPTGNITFNIFEGTLCCQ